MKRIVIKIVISVLFAFVATNSAFAQYRPSASINPSRVDNTVFHYGYTVGVGVFDYRVINNRYGGAYAFLAEPVKFSLAFRLGVIGEWNVTNYVSFRTVPGLYFGKRKITYKRDDIQIGGENVFTKRGYPLSIDAEVQSVYADIPLLMKYRGERINNYNFYLVGGVSYHMDLTPHNEIDPSKNRIIRTKRHDVALEFGGGLDFYLKYFKLGAELRISIGLIDVMNHDLVADMPDYNIYTKTVGSMKSTLVTLSFNFE